MSTQHTDRELLELAAKAARWQNVEFEDMRGWGEVRHGFSEALWIPELDRYWNALTDDGDALRLAVKLGIQIGDYHQYDRALAFMGATRGSGEFWETEGTPGEATRRAIVRAAAAIGEAMP